MALDNEGEVQLCALGVILILIGIGLAYNGVRRLLLVQKIKNTPTSKVRGAAVGLVELQGRAERKGDMVSPVTKVPCACWKVVAEYYYQTKNSSGWREFFGDESNDDFFLRDDTGRITVNPIGAELDIPVDVLFEGHLKDSAFFGLIPMKQLDERVLEYLEGNPLAKQAFENQGGRLMRLKEYFVGEGNEVYVLGTAMPKKGTASPIAEDNLFVWKGKHDGVLYISDTTEKDVLTKMDMPSWISLIGGLALVLGVLAIVVMNLF